MINVEKTCNACIALFPKFTILYGLMVMVAQIADFKIFIKQGNGMYQIVSQLSPNHDVIRYKLQCNQTLITS